MNKYTIIFIGFLICLLLSRVVSRGALAKLDTDTRHRIFDEFTPQNNAKLFFVVGLCIVYVLAINYVQDLITPLSIVFFAVFLAYFLFSMFSSRRRLIAMSAPADYIRMIMISWIIYIVGFAAIAVGVVYF